MPQRPSASLTARGEVIESEDELMAFMVDVGGAIAIWRGLHYNLLFTLTLAFIGIQDLGKGRDCSSAEHLLKQTAKLKMGLVHVKGGRMDMKCHYILEKKLYLEYLWDFFSICTVHVSLSDWPDMKQLTVGGRRMEEFSLELMMFLTSLKCHER